MWRSRRELDPQVTGHLYFSAHTAAWLEFQFVTRDIRERTSTTTTTATTQGPNRLSPFCVALTFGPLCGHREPRCPNLRRRTWAMAHTLAPPRGGGSDGYASSCAINRRDAPVRAVAPHLTRSEEGQERGGGERDALPGRVPEDPPSQGERGALRALRRGHRWDAASSPLGALAAGWTGAASLEGHGLHTAGAGSRAAADGLGAEHVHPGGARGSARSSSTRAATLWCWRAADLWPLGRLGTARSSRTSAASSC